MKNDLILKINFKVNFFSYGLHISSSDHPSNILKHIENVTEC